MAVPRLERDRWKQPQERVNVGEFEKLKHQWGPGLVKPSHFCEFYFEEAYQVLIVKTREKSSHAFNTLKAAISKYI